MNKKIIKQLLIALLGVFLLASCEYEYITIDTPAPPNPGDTTNPVDTISFVGEIEPIFQNTCTSTSCHSSNMSLNLTTGNAYNSIYTNGVVTPGDPNSSAIYTLPHPTTGSHYKNYSTTDDADKIYIWIYQGALDN